MDHFKLILVDPIREITDALNFQFEEYPQVEVVNNYFEKLPAFDCMVSAANSFGLMDGGVDLAISRFFGWDLMNKVQARIIDEYFGEQPVGTSMLVETGHPDHPFIAHTPTMRVPMEISRTDNVYLAMSAILREVTLHNQRQAQKINIVACPGLGTMTGMVPAREAARQMALAYDNFLNRPKGISWEYASDRQHAIRYGGDFGYRIPPVGE